MDSNGEAELSVNEDAGVVVLEVDAPALVLDPDQADDWCIAFHEAAKQAREARDE